MLPYVKVNLHCVRLKKSTVCILPLIFKSPALKWTDNNGIELPLWHLQHFLRRYMHYFISIWLIAGVTKQKMWQVGLYKIYEFGGMKLWSKHSMTTNGLKVFECVKKYFSVTLLKCNRDKHTNFENWPQSCNCIKVARIFTRIPYTWKTLWNFRI